MQAVSTTRKTLNRLASAAALIAAVGAMAPAHALVFNLTSTGNANADAGFQAAANFWQLVYIDPITVNVTAGFQALGAGILGQASSTYVNPTFAAFRGAMVTDSSSADDATMVAGLPVGSYSKYINGTTNSSGAAHVQSGITAMRLTSANAKALGMLAGNAAGQDVAITFSTSFSFDFDQSNGIGATEFDFVGIAIHELGHAMGFVSGVDVLDYNSNGVGVFGRFSDAQFSEFTNPLDFTRCSAASQAAGADMDWRIGQDAKAFAIDGNCTALVSNAWSTGVHFGDGRQASHWKDNLGIGIMDPTAVAPGSLNVVTSNDIQALDVIGWTQARVVNDVPEPASLLLLAVGLLGMSAARRKVQRA